MDNRSLIDILKETHSLDREQWIQLIDTFTDADRGYAADTARAVAQGIFGHDIYIRGIIEFSNICRNDCLYCGIRRSNTSAERYRLDEDEIISCCDAGRRMGFMTFVLQCGEDGAYPAQRLAALVQRIKERHPDCAVTLSAGEMEYADYKLLREAGADRYLLRHETASEEHYKRLHPSSMSFSHRMKCLEDLRELGFQVGAGMMIGSPYQTSGDLAEDMLFLGRFRPHMIGIGPFIPHKDTPFADMPAGSYELTLFILSLCRIMLPHVLLPATTALGTIRPGGREQGVLAGANVIMPNLSPDEVKKKYMLYDNKICTDESSDKCVRCIDLRLERIGYRPVSARGDYHV